MIVKFYNLDREFKRKLQYGVVLYFLKSQLNLFARLSHPEKLKIV